MYKRQVFHVSWNAEAAEKGGYEHFMLKEIHDQPKAVRDTFGTHISEDGKTAVSYTHLDVYKRQVIVHAIRTKCYINVM